MEQAASPILIVSPPCLCAMWRH